MLASGWMSTPTPALQPHWKAEVKLMSPRPRLRESWQVDLDNLRDDIPECMVKRHGEDEDQSSKLDVGKHGENDDSDDQVSKDEEMKEKSVKDKRPDPKNDELRDHMSECNGEDEDQISKLDVGRHGEDGDSDDQVSKDDEMKKKSVKDKRPDPKDDDSEDQVSRRLNSQVAGEGPQDPVSRRLNSRVAGEGPQDSVSWRFNIVQPPYFLEPQKLTMNRMEPQKLTMNRMEPQKLTMNRMSQLCKINSGSTEKVLLRNSSKYTALIDMDEREDKTFRKEVKVSEVIDKLKEVVKVLDTENSKIVFHRNSTESLESPQNSKIVFHRNSTESLESPQNSKIVLHRNSTENLESPQNSKIVLHRNSTASLESPQNSKIVFHGRLHRQSRVSTDTQRLVETFLRLTQRQAGLATRQSRAGPATRRQAGLATRRQAGLATRRQAGLATRRQVVLATQRANWTCNPAEFNKTELL